MKTTNKLLIGLAIALFVLPVGSMLIWAKANRLDQNEYNQAIQSEAKEFNTSDQYLVSKKVNPFDQVAISSSENAYVNVHLVKSNEFGYKISKGFENSFEYEVSKEGVLTLKAKENGNFFGSSIYIFAPEFNDLSFSRIQIERIETELDSLHLTLNNVSTQRLLGVNKNLKSLNLSLISSNIGFTRHDSESDLSLDQLTLKMDNSTFSLGKGTYSQIHADLDNSSLNVSSESREELQLRVNTLQVNALGKSTLGDFQISGIKNISGSISDSTTVLMPIYVYKGLLRK